ncbi:hypothetical protein P7K49_021323, partial [Saguinus oedipus]
MRPQLHHSCVMSPADNTIAAQLSVCAERYPPKTSARPDPTFPHPVSARLHPPQGLKHIYLQQIGSQHMVRNLRSQLSKGSSRPSPCVGTMRQMGRFGGVFTEFKKSKSTAFEAPVGTCLVGVCP